jgi:hypothetical protein
MDLLGSRHDVAIDRLTCVRIDRLQFRTLISKLPRKQFCLSLDAALSCMTAVNARSPFRSAGQIDIARRWGLRSCGRKYDGTRNSTNDRAGPIPDRSPCHGASADFDKVAWI